jgi:putative copper export protein
LHDVNARSLLALFDIVYLIALTAWVGGVLFFSFGVAPIIFKALGAEEGGKFVRALFPRYYAWGYTSGVVALAAGVLGPLSVPELRGPRVAVQAALIIVSCLVMLYCGNSLTPSINAARDAGSEGSRTFERLHRLSVCLNALVLVVGLGLLVAFATRPPPRTQGIVEPTALEQAQNRAEKWRKDGQSGASRPRPGLFPPSTAPSLP